MRPRCRLRSLALLSTLALASACTKGSPEKAADERAPAEEREPEPAPAPASAPLPQVATATTDSAPVSAPAGIVATMQLPSGTAITDLALAIDKVKPGASALAKLQLPTLLGQAVGMELDGAKLSAPLSLVVVDPSAHPQPLALLVAVEDLDKLRASAQVAGRELRERDGLALVGPPGVVSAAEAFAFANLGKYPDHSEIIVYPQSLLAAFRPQIDQGLAQMTAQLSASAGGPAASEMIQMYAELLVAMADQTERIAISIGNSQTSTDLFMRMYPREGSTLAAFTAAQAPGDHSLLSRLPSSGPGGAPPPALMSGTMLAGAAKQAIVDWSLEFMSSLYGGGEEGTAAWGAVLDAWLATLDGRFAMSMDVDLSAGTGVPKMSMRGLIGTTDSAAMAKSWREMMAMMSKATADGPGSLMGMSMQVSLEEGALEHDGVAIDLLTTTIDFSAMTPEQRAMLEAAGTDKQSAQVFAFDDVGGLASASEDGASASALIDAARGKGETFQPPAVLGSAIETSTKLGESLIYYLNFTELLPEAARSQAPFGALVFGMGRHGEALSLRVSMLE